MIAIREVETAKDVVVAKAANLPTTDAGDSLKEFVDADQDALFDLVLMENLQEQIAANETGTSSSIIELEAHRLVASSHPSLHHIARTSWADCTPPHPMIDERLDFTVRNQETTHQIGNEGSNRSKILSSSSFSSYFLRQSRMPVEKFVTRKSPPESVALRKIDHKRKQASMTIDVSDISKNRRLEFLNCGTNLREWLEYRNYEAKKMDTLKLFRQIVEIVNIAHARGVALVELKPSSFILSANGDVRYIGLVMENTRKLYLGQEINVQNCYHCECTAQKFTIGDVSTSEKHMLDSEMVEREKKWYSCPEGLRVVDLLSFNIYGLGLLLFELLCYFESIEAYSTVIMDLHHQILPPAFLYENPKEAELCFRLLHPEPSSRPTTWEILHSEVFHVSDNMNYNKDTASYASEVDEDETDLLLDFLVSLKEHKQDKASKVLESIKCVEKDIEMVKKIVISRKFSNLMNREHDSTLLKDKINIISLLEDAYFSMSSHVPEIPIENRSDKDMLQNREKLSRTPHNLLSMEENSRNRVGMFFDGFCKYARYKKFEECGMLRTGDILKSDNVISSLSFDREEEYLAAAGVSKKIKIFELSSLLNEYTDVQYPVVEMSNKSKLSCICWNHYIKNYLASADYDGFVQVWDASTGQVFVRYEEHANRAWSVDFSQADPVTFASGSDDGSVKIWNISEKNSISTISNRANVCCVQFSPFNSNLLCFGSADYRISCYDLRHTKIPWCTLSGHQKAVSYVRFLDSETLISASTDNTLKLWDLNKTCLEGLSSSACNLTFTGHINEKHFVGLSTLDGYIVCGSENNEVYAYYRSLSMPITSHKFGCIDLISGCETTSGSANQFVSSVCWRRKSDMIAAANSSGSIKILRML